MENYSENNGDLPPHNALTKDGIPEFHRANRPQFLQKLGSYLVKKVGWRITGKVPDEHLIVVAAAPHTSNWDFVLAVLMILALDLKVNVLMKDTAFLPGLGRLFKKLGFIPVNRREPAGFVEKIATLMKEQKTSILVLTPEGTRSKVEEWKSGFVRLALASAAKILLVSIDYKYKEVGLGKVITPSNEIDWQVGEIRKYFGHVTPKNPENF